MTIEEIIKHQEQLIEFIKIMNIPKYPTEENEMIIAALEKQIPKEATTQGISQDGCWIIKCPECDTVMEGKRNIANYCCQCGQALKWGD